MSDQKPLQKKTKSLQETINVYLNMLPKPNRNHIKVFDLNPVRVPESSQRTAVSKGSIKNQSMLKKLDNLIKSTSQSQMKIHKILKPTRSSDLVLDIMTPALIDPATTPRTYQNTLPRYSKIQTRATPKSIPSFLIKKAKEKPPPKIIKFLSPQYSSRETKAEHPIHIRKNSSLSISRISISAWPDELP